MRWLQLAALAALAALVHGYVDVTCSAAFCKEFVSTNGCPKLPVSCTEANLALGLAVLLPSPSLCNCCDFCITSLAEGEACVVGGTNQNVPVCGPGLTCVKPASLSEPSLCRPLNTACTLAQRDWDAARENGTLGFRVRRPECNAVGDFLPAHCIPGATCYCVSPDNERLFGELPFTAADTPQQMTCSCSVSRWRATRAVGEASTVLRCAADGRFDTLQCVDSKCSCVDADDGSRDGTAWLLEADLAPETLKCFDPALHPTGSFRKGCQLERFQVEQTLGLLALDGLTGLGLKPPRCDADGTYAKLQETTATWLCVDPEGVKLEDFEVSKTAMAEADMDCHCARSRWLLSGLQSSSGLLLDEPACCGAGGYQRWQCVRGRCFCVDRHGNQQGVERARAEELACFDPAGPCVGLH